jgi:fructose-1,6-bisphosphatase-3
VPKVSELRVYDPPRLIGDTEEGDARRQDIAALERLMLAYDEGALVESPAALF